MLADDGADKSKKFSLSPFFQAEQIEPIIMCLNVIKCHENDLK